MINGFMEFSPAAWAEGVFLTTSRTPKNVPAKKRKSEWVLALSRPVATVATASLVAIVLTLAPRTIASSFDAIQPKPQNRQKQADPDLSPLQDINRAFNTLFDSFRSGTSLIAGSERMSLASGAVQRRNEQVNIDEWARTLASDIKEAKD